MVNIKYQDGRHPSHQCSSLRISRPASYITSPGWYNAGLEVTLYRLEMMCNPDPPCTHGMGMMREILFYMFAGWQVGGHVVYFLPVFVPEGTVCPFLPDDDDLLDDSGTDDSEKIPDGEDGDVEISADVVIADVMSDDEGESHTSPVPPDNRKRSSDEGGGAPRRNRS